jgi:integrase/recombinase XerD
MASFDDFVRHRKFFVGVSPATLSWYEYCFRWINENPSQADLQNAVISMRERGLKATGINSAISCWNAYAHWLAIGSDVKCGQMCKHPKIARLREPEHLPPTFSDSQIHRLVTYKPKHGERRTHLIALTLFDTGGRISELLNLRVSNVDLDNLLAKLRGKGDKERVVPISPELRKAVHRYIVDFERRSEQLLFATRNETPLGRRNVLRDVKRLCKRLGFAPPGRTLHAARHSFATGYLRRGGNALALQRVMGHADLETTRRYVHLTVEDLKAAHEKTSLLKPRLGV